MHLICLVCVSFKCDTRSFSDDFKMVLGRQTFKLLMFYLIVWSVTLSLYLWMVYFIERFLWSCFRKTKRNDLQTKPKKNVFQLNSIAWFLLLQFHFFMGFSRRIPTRLIKPYSFLFRFICLPLNTKEIHVPLTYKWGSGNNFTSVWCVHYTHHMSTQQKSFDWPLNQLLLNIN